MKRLVDFFLPRRQFAWGQHLEALQQLLAQRPIQVKVLQAGYEEQLQALLLEKLNDTTLQLVGANDGRFKMRDLAATAIWLPVVTLRVSNNAVFVNCGLRFKAWSLLMGGVLASVGMLWVYVNITDRALAPLLSVPAGFFILTTVFFAYNFATTYRVNCAYVLQQLAEALQPKS